MTHVGLALKPNPSALCISCGARAAQLNELLRLAGSGKKPQALNLFRQAFPTLSASEAEQAVKILASGSVG